MKNTLIWELVTQTVWVMIAMGLAITLLTSTNVGSTLGLTIIIVSGAITIAITLFQLGRMWSES